ncbi:DUF2470 domain-containing protein [Asanoa iriomotensis]|uniref:DUF2470 domain-containing protein n=1 Tax=Asanoa iriomotensis TaxID=234613 RepID=A0ABQ4C6M5_9ACTN|nr:DUF2470 domain-containing protein [Asanoa iriomotensis]GIF58428.1 hypothetical protein Air01nite_45230 [Asanoa iriomotensis]
MRPTAAEVARTLANGRLEGTAHIRGYPGRVKVRHATPADGHPLLLVALGTDLATALTSGAAARSGPMVLSVDDVPPTPSSPSRGRLWLTGEPEPLDGPEARAAADAYAQVSPLGDLLDVGRFQMLFRIETSEVRLANGRALVELDPAEFRAAAPDPLAAEEGRLLHDLNDHHLGQLAGLVERVSGRAAPTDCRALRMDRYGLVVGSATGGGQRLRLGFERPVGSVCELNHLMHALLAANGVAAH